MIKIEFKGLKDIVKGFEKLPEIEQKAKVSALNNTAKQARTEASKQIRQEYGIKAGDLSKRDVKTKLSRLGYEKAKESNGYISSVVGRGHGLPLKYFGARQTGKGASVAIIKGNRRVIAHAFGPDIERLGGHVFRRLGKKRFPIGNTTTGKTTYMFGPGVATMLNKRAVYVPVQRFVADNFIRIYEHELKYYSGKIVK
jgi:hypothetical protein